MQAFLKNNFSGQSDSRVVHKVLEKCYSIERMKLAHILMLYMLFVCIGGLGTWLGC